MKVLNGYFFGLIFENEEFIPISKSETFEYDELDNVNGKKNAERELKEWIEEKSKDCQRIFFPTVIVSVSSHLLFNSKIEVRNSASYYGKSTSNIFLIPKEGNFKCLFETINNSDILKLAKALNEIIVKGDIDEIIRIKLTEDLELTKSKVNETQTELNQLLMDEQERNKRIEILRSELEESQTELLKIKSDLASL